MPIAKELLEILCCPESRRSLIYFPAQGQEEEFLFCPESKLRYRIDDGIPVLLIEEAQRLDDDEVARLVAAAHDRGLA